MRIEFAYPHDVDGVTYKPDEVAEVDSGVAASLIAKGLARKAKPAAPAPVVVEKTAPKTPKESA